MVIPSPAVPFFSLKVNNKRSGYHVYPLSQILSCIRYLKPTAGDPSQITTQQHRKKKKKKVNVQFPV